VRCGDALKEIEDPRERAPAKVGGAKLPLGPCKFINDLSAAKVVDGFEFAPALGSRGVTHVAGVDEAGCVIFPVSAIAQLRETWLTGLKPSSPPNRSRLQ
jgi:hypothetical protein